jgi:hypothetical protein
MTDRDAQLTKRVDYVAKDAEEQTATGVVMVPNTVDHQGDWERPATIEAFANQFGAFMDVDEADGGVMHAVWPSEWMSLDRNEVLDAPEEIGGRDVPEGAWVQRWAYHDDDLWGLVEDDILGGHSIGAVNAQWDFNGEDPEDLPDDVTVPDEVDVAEYWELTDGIVQEVSAVDIPAVPDAQILSTSKARAATAEKRLSDHLGNRDGFIEEAQERGHSEEAAERLWSVLDRGINVEGAGEPGAKAKLTSAATAFLNALTGADSGDGSERRAGAQAAKNASSPDRVTKEDTVGVDVFRITAADDDDTDYDGDLLGMGVDFPEHDVYVDWRRDAFPDALEDPHVSIYGSMEDLEQATGNQIESLDTVDSPTDGFASEAQRIRQKALKEADNHAPEGDTSDAGGSETEAANNTDMSNDDPMADAPEWAKALDDRIDSLESEKDADEGTDDDLMADAPEWAKDLSDRVDEIEAEKDADEGKPEWAKNLEERVDAISKQTGTDTQQLGKSGEEETEKDGGFTLDPRKARR